MRLTAAVVLSTALLAACGGGGSSTPPPVANNPPPPPPPPPPPSPPLGFGTPAFAAIAAGDGAITVAWAPVSSATSFSIYYATQPGVTPQNYATLSHGGKVSAPQSPSSLSRTINGFENGSSVYVVITAVTTGFESDPTGVMQAVVQAPSEPPKQGSRRLADTGITACADGERTDLPCPVAGFPGQDADYGRDADAANLTKVGAGVGGFDFTKLDANGAPLPADASEWSCVKDNHTQLIWEAKTRDGGLRDVMSYYTWYDPDMRKNAGNMGLEDQGHCSGSKCDTLHYAQAVNATQLCGFGDWRLPTRVELLSIVNYGRRSPATDTTFFPDVPPSTYFANTWTSSNTARGIGNHAWTVEFDGGYVLQDQKRDFGRVRLVRGEPSSGIP